MSRRPESPRGLALRPWRASPACGRHRPDRPGFTLVELALAMAVGAILLVALGGALMLPPSAADSGDDSTARVLEASGAAATLGAELATATAIPIASPTDLGFIVPDRNGDGSVEKIAYTWSGKPGTPLYRSYNASTPAPVIPAIGSLDLDVVSRPPAVPVESAERVLASCESPTGATYQSDDVDSNLWDAQYVRPVLPSGATAWKITRVRVFLRQASGSNSNVWRLSIRQADSALKPTGAALASVSATSGSVSSSASWVEYAIGPVAGLAPGQGVCIVLDGSPGGKVTVARAENGGSLPFNTHFVSSANAGASWSTPTDTKDLRFVLTGTYTTMVEP